jgi:adhesin HecA-like repeat protein
VIAATGDIKISADGRLQLQQLDAGGDIRVQSAAAIDSNASVYAAGKVEMQSAERIAIHSGLRAAGGKLSLAAEQIDNHSSLLAGLDADGVLNDRGELAIQSRQLVNSGALTATSRIDIDTGELLNRGLINADNYLQVNAASLVNEATLFSGWNTQLQVRSSLLNSTDAVIFTVNDLLLAADNEQRKTAQITNQLGLIQLGYEKIYYDLGNGREVSQPGDAMTIDLAYSSGYTKHNANARDRWIREVLRRLNSQAPLLYAANAPNIRNERSALFDAIETRLVDQSTTTPAYLDSGKDLTLHVDEFNNHDSVTSAAGNIHFDVSGDYRNQASSITETVTDYQYYTYADHDSNWKNDDKYSSIGRSGYIDKQRSKRVSANTVTQAGGAIDGEIGGQLANAGVLQGQYQSSAALDPASFTRSGIVLPQNDFGLFVRTSDPQSRYRQRLPAGTPGLCAAAIAETHRRCLLRVQTDP